MFNAGKCAVTVAVLFKEKWYFMARAMRPNISCPIQLHAPFSGACFGADDDPVQGIFPKHLVKTDGPQQRFARNEAFRRGRGEQNRDAFLGALLVFCCYAEPKVSQWSDFTPPHVISMGCLRKIPLYVIAHTMWPFREDHKRVMTMLFYHFHHTIQPCIGHVFVEKVRHAADEDAAWFFPAGGHVQFVLVEGQLKRVFFVVSHAAGEAFCHSRGVAMLAALADGGAAGDWVERFICPFNL